MKKMRDAIAIVGMGCRFPGASSPQAFWQLLKTGKSSIKEIPRQRWNKDAFYDPDSTSPGKTTSRWGGYLDQVDQFDWRALRLLPHEAESMDPQHRLLLEVAWEALEDAGIPFPEVAGSSTSVFIGIGWNDYLRLQTRNWSEIDGYTSTGNASSLAANRLSYFFDFKGPSVALDTGCTSSLTSLYLACQSLWTQEADMALAGGVSLLLSPDTHIMSSKAGLLASDGRCKTFDAHADGFVLGEGAGILVLKPFSQVKPSDRVYALVQGISSAHNGHNEWIVATSQVAQEQLLKTVYQRAAIDPTEVDYVELHGTGFLRGDAVEATALGNVLGTGDLRARPCLVGSVKTNIG
ncbi:MAG TPA: polyketide synthase, partial [Ktedonobacteraceae bacterium]